MTATPGVVSGEEVDTVSISQIFCGRKNRNRMTDVRGYNVKKGFHLVFAF